LNSDQTASEVKRQLDQVGAQKAGARTGDQKLLLSSLSVSAWSAKPHD